MRTRALYQLCWNKLTQRKNKELPLVIPYYGDENNVDQLEIVLEEEDPGVETHTLKNDDDGSDKWPQQCPCPPCPDKTFYTPEGLHLHVIEFHPKGQVVVSNDSKTVTCFICKDKTFYNNAEYDAHLLKYHPTLDPKDSPKEKTLRSHFFKDKKLYPKMNCLECKDEISCTRMWVHLKEKHNYTMENFASNLFICNICKCNHFASVTEVRKHDFTKCQTNLEKKERLTK